MPCRRIGSHTGMQVTDGVSAGNLLKNVNEIVIVSCCSENTDTSLCSVWLYFIPRGRISSHPGMQVADGSLAWNWLTNVNEIKRTPSCCSENKNISVYVHMYVCI